MTKVVLHYASRFSKRPYKIAYPRSSRRSRSEGDGWDLEVWNAHRARDAAFTSLEEATQEPVDWAYEVWDDLLRILREGDNRQRAIGAQILCNLAQSDPKGRMVQDVEVLLGVTKDERFVTARHCLQSLWKVAVAGERQREAVVKGPVRRFQECRVEKNGTLIRYDILAVLRRVYDATSDPEVRSRAEALMDLEEDPKYRKKYATLWRV